MRRALQGNVECTMNGDPVIEVDRVPHPPERTLADAFDLAVHSEHASRGVRDTALATDQRFFAIPVAVLAGADRHFFAPLFVATARHVRDHHRLVVVVDRQHLFGQIDLGVVWRGVWTARLDDEGLLQLIPHFGGDLAGRSVARRCEDQLLVSPNRLEGLIAVDAVSRARDEAEFGESLLHELDVVASKPLRQGTFEWDLDDWSRRCDGTDDVRDGFGNRQRIPRRIDHECSVSGNPLSSAIIATAQSNTRQNDRPEQACCGNGWQPLGSLVRRAISSRGTLAAGSFVHESRDVLWEIGLSCEPPLKM